MNTTSDQKHKSTDYQDMSSNLSEFSSGDDTIQCSNRNDDVISSCPSIESSRSISHGSGTPPSIKGTDELKAVHKLEDMGFSMDVVLKAIEEIKSTDIPILLNHILFLGNFLKLS